MLPLSWEDMTGPEVAAHTAAYPREVGLLPVGATEQHGPHLPTGTDTIIAKGLAEAVSARTGAPVLPAVSIACSYGHGRSLGGTLSLSPEQTAAEVMAIADWAASSGLRRILAVNAHMGNSAALMVASDHIRLERPDLRIGLVNWWEAAPDVAALMTTDGDDIHANRGETSLMLALAPDRVRRDLLATADDEDRTAGLVFRYTATSLSVNGVTGRPSEADESFGASLLEITVSALCERVERARLEEPPLVEHRPAPRLTAGAGAAPGSERPW